MKITIILTLIISNICIAQNDTENFIDRADKGLSKFVEDNAHAGVSAGFGTAEDVLWIGAAGYANVKSSSPMKPETLTRIASIAKPMTAIAILQLHEQGAIGLDKDINDYIPDFPISDKGPFTIRQLLAHTSGIAGYKNSKEVESKKEFKNLAAAVDLFKNRKLQFAPGKNFSYTSYGYTLLGLIIEKVSGMSYEDYMQNNVWNPAGMNHTGIEKIDTKYKNKSSLYSRKKNGKIVLGKQNNLSDRIPGGGFYSTPEDLLKFGQAIINNTLITGESLTLMTTDTGMKTEGNPYGLGWYLYGQDEKSKSSIIGHSGGQTGVSSMLMILPEAGIVSVVLSNTSRTDFEVGGLATGLFRLAYEMKTSNE